MFKFDLKYAPLTFKRPSGTSRGILTEKYTWYLTLITDTLSGIGEVSIIPGLTKEFDDLSSYQQWLESCIHDLNSANLIALNFTEYIQKWQDKPSLYFALETAFLDCQAGGNQRLFDTSFTRKETGIPINGLIWMGDESFMKEQIAQKIEEGYSCIKMKIGAIDFKTELKLLEAIRKTYSASEITLRVDANGAFAPHEALTKLQLLNELGIHSIEQPIQAGQWNLMAELCVKTPCPIALDEELIGIYDYPTKIQLLEKIQPQYIILKPSLHGGLKGCQEWIELADSMHIPWWITSALESNIGLNAIAQFVSTYPISLHQGLGTGGLYTTNTPSTTEIKGGYLWFR
jgi:o-succinylbenzoate synthase